MVGRNKKTTANYHGKLPIATSPIARRTRPHANRIIAVRVRFDPSLQGGRVGRRDGSSGRLIDRSIDRSINQYATQRLQRQQSRPHMSHNKGLRRMRLTRALMPPLRQDPGGATPQQAEGSSSGPTTRIGRRLQVVFRRCFQASTPSREAVVVAAGAHCLPAQS
jgi:hypothetical protein